MWKILTAASTALVLLGTPALAQYADWDFDADARLGYGEFAGGFAETGAYDAWDVDDDYLLTQDEWTAGFGDAYDADRWGTFADWDVDETGFLTEEEFTGGVFRGYGYDPDDDVLVDVEQFGGMYSQDDIWQ